MIRVNPAGATRTPTNSTRRRDRRAEAPKRRRTEPETGPETDKGRVDLRA